jgi:hypothetical protein
MTKQLIITLLFAAVNCQSGEDSLYAETMSYDGTTGEKEFTEPEKMKGQQVYQPESENN